MEESHLPHTGNSTSPYFAMTSNFFETREKRPQPPISIMIFQLLVVAFHLPSTAAFGNALFQKAPSAQQKAPSRTPDRVEIELPDFDELFNRVQQVSPLAKVAIESANDVAGYTAGFGEIGKTACLKTTVEPFLFCAHIFGFFAEENPNLKWKKVDSSKKEFGVHKGEY